MNQGHPILPDAFLSAMEVILGDEYEDFLDAMKAPLPVSVNKHIQKEIGLWENYKGVKWYDKGVYLPTRPSFTLDPAFHAGAYYVQEASSMFLAEAVRQLALPPQSLRALDLCAAPGGKSALLANILPADSLLVSNEVIKSRYQTLRYNMDKWGLPNLVTTQHDSQDFQPLAGWFDLVLVDAPCSGEGMFRKDLDAVGEWSPAHVLHCAARQRRILAEAASLVRPGGYLIYSTCTYNKTENDENAAWLAQQEDWSIQPLELPTDWGIVQRSPGYQLYPHRVDGEGLYLCVLKRTGGESAEPSRKASDFRKLSTAPKAELERVKPWLAQPDDMSYWIQPSGSWRAIPQRHLADIQSLSQVLNRLEGGFLLGDIKGKELIPSPELALHTALSPSVNRLELKKETALSILRKETPELSQSVKGWALVCYEGLGLGWVKGLGHRYNNYYPKEWRIRMLK